MRHLSWFTVSIVLERINPGQADRLLSAWVDIQCGDLRDKSPRLQESRESRTIMTIRSYLQQVASPAFRYSFAIPAKNSRARNRDTIDPKRFFNYRFQPGRRHRLRIGNIPGFFVVSGNQFARRWSLTLLIILYRDVCFPSARQVAIMPFVVRHRRAASTSCGPGSIPALTL